MFHRALILDHRSSWSGFAARILSALGYQTVESARLEELLDPQQEPTEYCRGYTLIIVDSLSDRTEDHITKPLETAGTIARLCPETSLVVVSSRPSPYEAARAFCMGASDYIPKTFDEKRLIKLGIQAQAATISRS